VSAITTHVLDTSRGRPAAGVPVILEVLTVEGGSAELGSATTDADGRVRDIGPARLETGRYRLVFGTTAYFASIGQSAFFPEVSVTFGVSDPAQHYHVPLLLSPFAYSTYRGS
jgi:5-hydroxyisourate hydrolase